MLKERYGSGNGFFNILKINKTKWKVKKRIDCDVSRWPSCQLQHLEMKKPVLTDSVISMTSTVPTGYCIRLYFPQRTILAIYHARGWVIYSEKDINWYRNVINYLGTFILLTPWYSDYVEINLSVDCVSWKGAQW